MHSPRHVLCLLDKPVLATTRKKFYCARGTPLFENETPRDQKYLSSFHCMLTLLVFEAKFAQF